MLRLKREYDTGEDRRTNYLTYLFDLNNIEVFFNNAEESFNIINSKTTKIHQKVREDIKSYLIQAGPILNLNIISPKQGGDPDIVEISYSDLKKMGFALISFKSPYRLFQHQKVTYKIIRQHLIPQKKLALPALPVGHEIQFDRNNNRVRLTGKNVGRTKESEWKIV